MGRRRFESREDWLRERRNGIGGSEVAAIVGLSKWKTATELWQEKVFGLSKDLSDNEAVSKGVRLEPYLRGLFTGLHPEYHVEYYPYDILYQDETPYFFATLDGELTDSDGKHAVLEIKTATPQSKRAWTEWNEGLPMNYLCQTVWQLYCSGYDYVILFAALFGQEGDITLREYLIDRNDPQVQTDMEYLVEKATEFWKSVETKQIPKLNIKL